MNTKIFEITTESEVCCSIEQDYDEKELMSCITNVIFDRILSDQDEAKNDIAVVIEDYQKIEMIDTLAYYLRYNNHLDECQLLKMFHITHFHPARLVAYEVNGHCQLFFDIRSHDKADLEILIAVALANTLSRHNHSLTIFSILYVLFSVIDIEA